MKLDNSIFRAYDIRGIYGETLTEDIMEKIGMALGTMMIRQNMGKDMLVGNDIRKSSPSLSKSFIKGMRSMGINVVDVGTTSFGVTLYSGWVLKKDVTAYITASHNPPQWNGIKFFDKDSIGFFEENNKEIGRIISEGDYIEYDGKLGGLKKVDKSGDYIEFLMEKFHFENPVKVIVDCGNGSTSVIAKELFNSFENIDVEIIFDEIDPSFSDRGADVKKKNLEKLSQTVISKNADIGVGFDGDGDRVGVVDNVGNVLPSEKVMVIISEHMKKDGKNDVVVNVEASMTIEKMLGDDVNVHRIPVGHTYMMQNVMKYGAIFGGEPSSHYVIPDYLPFDDAVVAALKLIEIVSENELSISEIGKNIPNYPKTREAVKCEDKLKFTVIENLKDKLSKKFENVNTLDGIRIDMDNGWALIRASNTSPVIRLTVEADNEQTLEKMKLEFLNELELEIDRIKTMK